MILSRNNLCPVLVGVRKIIAEYPSYYGNLKIVGFQPKGQKKLSHYILYQNGFIQNIVQ